MVSMMYVCVYISAFVTLQTCISYFEMEDVSRKYLMNLIFSTSQ